MSLERAIHKCKLILSLVKDWVTRPLVTAGRQALYATLLGPLGAIRPPCWPLLVGDDRISDRAELIRVYRPVWISPEVWDSIPFGDQIWICCRVQPWQQVWSAERELASESLNQDESVGSDSTIEYEPGVTTADLEVTHPWDCDCDICERYRWQDYVSSFDTELLSEEERESLWFERDWD